MYLKSSISASCSGCSPHHPWLLPDRASSPSVQPLLPASCLLLVPLVSVLTFCRQGQEYRGVSECTIRSWRRSLPSLDFTAMSLGLFLQLAGRSDLWLPLLFSASSFPMSPRQICFSCSLLKGCSAMTAGGSDHRLGSGRGKVNSEWPSTSHALLLQEHQDWARCNLLLLAWDTSASPRGRKAQQEPNREMRENMKWHLPCTKHQAKSPCHANETFLSLLPFEDPKALFL